MLDARFSLIRQPCRALRIGGAASRWETFAGPGGSLPLAMPSPRGSQRAHADAARGLMGQPGSGSWRVRSHAIGSNSSRGHAYCKGLWELGLAWCA